MALSPPNPAVTLFLILQVIFSLHNSAAELEKHTGIPSYGLRNGAASIGTALGPSNPVATWFLILQIFLSLLIMTANRLEKHAGMPSYGLYNVAVSISRHITMVSL